MANNKTLVFFYDMHQKAIDLLSKYTFFIIVVTLLGTPITLGFFLKIAILSNIIIGGKLVTILAILINLILIVFYLQALRHNQLQRKKRKTRANTANGLREFSCYASLFLLSSAFLITPLFDIATALL